MSPLSETERAIDVLYDDDRLAPGFHQERFELVIVVDACELEIVDIVMEVVGYGSYEARLACSRRAMEEVTPLPGTAEAVVAILAVAEVMEVVEDPAAELRV